MKLQQAMEMVEALNSDRLDSINDIRGYEDEIAAALHKRVVELESGLSAINDMRFSMNADLLSNCLEIASNLID